MHITIDFSPQASGKLSAAARSRGIEPAALLERLVDECLPFINANPVMDFPSTGRGAARLRARLAAEATDDPETIRKAQEALDTMKRSMNEERLRSGAEPIF